MTVLAAFFLVSAASVVISFSGFVSGCTKPSQKGPQKAPSGVAGTGSDVVSTFALVGHTETGRKKWEIRGETADLLGETVRLSPVAATNFGDVDVHLTAKQGQFHKVNQDVHLEGDVVVTTSDGAKLTTESLDWIAQRETGRTSDWVTVTRPGMKVVGLGGVGFPKLKRLRVEQDVTVTLHGQEGETVITCNGPMEIDYGRRKARFWRNVHVRDGRGTIHSDRMDVALDSQTSKIHEAAFWGHVQIHHKNQKAFCQLAKYWQDPGRTRLMGHTRIVMLPEDERVGE